MLKTTLLLIAITLTLSLSAQPIDLGGIVSVQNSEYHTGTRQYVQGATIQADYTKDKWTDSFGKFTLTFADKNRGDSVVVQVSKNDMEVVNQKALQDVVVGRLTPLRIYMCQEGKLAENILYYNNISLRNLHAERDRRIARLQQGGSEMEAEIARLQTELNLEIWGKNDAIHQLNKQIAAAEAQLPEFASKLAQVNLDDASDRYKRAYELYLDGKIQEAIQLLDLKALKQAGLDAGASIQEIERHIAEWKAILVTKRQEIEQTVMTLELGAQLLTQQFQYRQAAEYYQAIIAILESDPDGRQESIGYYQIWIGRRLDNIGDYPKALDYYLQALGNYQVSVGDMDGKTAMVHNNLAGIYKTLGLLDKALTVQQKALEIWEQIYEENHPLIATAYNNLAQLYQALGQLKKALTIQQKALNIDLKNFNNRHPRIAAEYNNLAQLYQALGQLDKALTMQQKALEIDEQVYEVIHPVIAIDYNNLAMIYQDLGQLDKALTMQQKALEIDEQVYKNIHPTITRDYNNLAMIYKDLGQLDKALKAQQKVLEIDEQIFKDTHPNMARDYNNLSIIYQELGQFDKALEMQQKALSIYEIVFHKEHYTIGMAYGNLAHIYENKKNWQAAKDNIDKALFILQKALGENNSIVSQVFMEQLFINIMVEGSEK